jgi:hypothetical protein
LLYYFDKYFKRETHIVACSSPLSRPSCTALG